MKKSMLWKKNNKGSSMVMVVVAVAMISILVATMLATTLTNYHMKQQERMEKSSFYSAEGALEEIKAGLQQQVSQVIEEVYLEVMESYSITDDRQAYFDNSYIEKLRTYYKDSVGMAGVEYYDIDILNSYLNKSVVKNNGGEYVYGAVLPGATVAGIPTPETPIATDYRLELTTEGLAFRNLVIEYTDKRGNVSIIKTDILLEYPKINLNGPSEMPDLPSYALVANENLMVDDSQTLEINGNVYAGKDTLKIGDSATFDIDEVKTMIANNVEVGRSATLSNNTGGNNVWVNNIIVTSGTVALLGNTYVANDLNVNGVHSYITLGGNYQGFGTVDAALNSQYYRFLIGETTNTFTMESITNNKADYSSAIVINGKDTDLDLSGLSRLSLADNAYVSALGGVQSKEDSSGVSSPLSMIESTPDVDVQMGESITIKSNQLAYLAPPEIVGVGVEHGGVNPMTDTTYNSLISECNSAGIDLISKSTKISSIGLSLEELAAVSENPVHVTGGKTVFYPVGNTSIVYVFLEFADTESANNYFKWYYEANKSELDDYLNIYNNSIQFSEEGSATVDLSGNIMVGDSEEGYTYQSDTTEIGNSDISQQRKQIDIYAAMKLKMISDYSKLTPMEQRSDVYKNLIDVAKVDTIPTSDLSGAKTFKKGTGDNEIIGKVVNGSCTVNTNAIKKGFIIADGNVTVEGGGTFEGIIIASGTITVKNGCKVISSPDNFKSIIQEPAEGDPNDYMLNYLINGESYLLGGISGTNTGIGTIDASELVVTRNWQKQ